MIVRPLRALSAGVIFLFATAAQAQSTPSSPHLPNPWYIAFGAGGAWYEDWALTGAPDVSLNTGWTANTAFGRYLDDIRVVRLEGEVMYDEASISGVGGAAASGTLSNIGAMLNIYYDIRTGTNWTPYLGGGLGYSYVTLDSLASAGVMFAGSPLSVDDNDGAFAWQIKAGVTYQFSPTWAVNLGYRYFGTDNLSFQTTSGTNLNTEGTRIHNAEIGFRLHF